MPEPDAEGHLWGDRGQTVTVYEGLGLGDFTIAAGTVCLCDYEPTLDGFVVTSAACTVQEDEEPA